MKPIVSSARAKSLAIVVFLTGLAIVSISNTWWPEILPAAGVAIAFRHFLLGQLHDMFLSLVIFFGAYAAYRYPVPWPFFWPFLFLSAALYVLVYEFLLDRTRSEAEIEEDLGHELAEHLEKKEE